MTASDMRRTYHAPRRVAQAAATRTAIVGAAARLFARHGYAATTMAAIAEEAGVTPKSVYAVADKPGLLLLAVELADTPTGERSGKQAGERSGTRAGERGGTRAGERSGTQAREQDGTRAGEQHGTRAGERSGTRAGEQGWARAGERGLTPIGPAAAAEALLRRYPVQRAFEEAAAAEPALRDAWRRHERQRRAELKRLVRAAADAGTLRAGLSVGRATDALWALVTWHTVALLVEQRGWSRAELSAWLGQLVQTVLTGAAPGRGAPPEPAGAGQRDG